MSISRRLRFEILRRDDHACRYCGGRAPDVALTVDHVIPVALGGSDDASNLVTACQECNAGKSSTQPDQHLVDEVAVDALRWGAAMARAAAIQAAQTESRTMYINAFDECWGLWKYEDGRTVTRTQAWTSTVGRWHDQGLELAILCELVHDVLPREIPDGRMWPYFCGAVRNVLERRQEIARELIGNEEA